jgi:transposase-like protein
MIKFRLIGATALSLVLALPPSAMADEMQRTDGQRSKDQVRTVTPRANANSIDPNLPVENALRWVTVRDIAITPRAGVVSTETAATPAM